MLFSPPQRDFKAELLDLDEAPFDEVRKSLKDVRRVNRYLSGYRVLLEQVGDFFSRQEKSRPFTVIDLATGSADQPLALLKYAQSLGVDMRITAVDINGKMLAYASEETARHPEIKLVQADILSLPFADNSFDVAINSLSLHHFSRENAIGILRSALRVSRMGVVINDLHRSRVAYAAILLLTRLFTQNRLTRYDAPVSVMNAFTPSEMREMAEEADWKNFQVHRRFPYRLALVARK